MRPRRPPFRSPAAHADVLPAPGATRFDVDGRPIVSHLVNDAIAVDGDTYMRRYFLQRSREMSVRVHEILRSDAGRELHDHPWDFTTLLLHGTYEELTDDGVSRFYSAPTILHRTAETLHRLVLHDGPVWTYVVTGPVRRKWGFQTDAGWVHHSEYDNANPSSDNQK